MRTLQAIAIIVGIFAVTLGLRTVLTPPSDAANPAPASIASPLPRRVVSLAPSITETLFALGLGDRVVGVTRYCNYPPEAQQKTVVGGFLDPNYEAIVRLEPDLAAMLVIHDDAKRRLDSLGIATLQVDHRTVDGILESFLAMGEACGVEEQAVALVASCRARMQRIADATAGLPRPRVLISSARELGSGRIESVYVAGRGQWYDELLRLAGGENAYPDDGLAFPEVSAEGLLRLDPDVIIDMVPDVDNKPYTLEEIVAEWDGIPGLRAVESGHVYALGGDYVSIPGPRFIDVLEDIARILHPDAEWGTP